MVNLLKKVSPTAYTVISVVSNGVAIGLSIIATKKTIDEFEKKNPQTFREKATIAVKNYLPTFLAFSAGTGAAVASNAFNIANQTAIAGAAAVIAQNASEYKKTVKDIVSPEDNEKIEKEYTHNILNDKVKDIESYPALDDPNHEPHCWCIEATTRQIIWFPYHRAKEIEYRMVELLKSRSTVALWEYYDVINQVCGNKQIESTNISFDLGWRDCDMMDEASGEVRFPMVILEDKAKDGRPVLLIDTDTPPYAGFDKDE